MHSIFKGAQDEVAINCFSRLLNLAPNNGLGHLGLGTKALQEGRFKDAVKDLQQGQFSLQQKMLQFTEINEMT